MFTMLIFSVALVLALGVITLNPDRTRCRLTTDNNSPNNGQQLPTCIASAAMTNPGPVMPAATQNNPSGNCICQHASGAGGGTGYIGYNIRRGVAAGEPLGVFRGVVVDGFVGVVPGSAVYVDATTADAAADATGLSHTANGTPIGVGLTPTKIRFH
jgi:hypothetical protein